MIGWSFWWKLDSVGLIIIRVISLLLKTMLRIQFKIVALGLFISKRWNFMVVSFEKLDLVPICQNCSRIMALVRKKIVSVAWLDILISHWYFYIVSTKVLIVRWIGQNLGIMTELCPLSTLWHFIILELFYIGNLHLVYKQYLFLLHLLLRLFLFLS